MAPPRDPIVSGRAGTEDRTSLLGLINRRQEGVAGVGRGQPRPDVAGPPPGGSSVYPDREVRDRRAERIPFGNCIADPFQTTGVPPRAVGGPRRPRLDR